MAAYTNIDDPSAFFQTAIYTGAGANTTVTNDGNSDLQPDFLWIKNRGAGYDHVVWDSNRNLGSATNAPLLKTNSTAVENSSQNWWNATNNGINTDGFQFGSSQFFTMNYTSNTYVGWQWKANGGTTSTNTDGDINSTVQVNQDAGFSIVTDSPTNNTARSIGHGLGVAPQVIIRRARNRVESWRVFHSAAGSTGSLKLNDASAYNSSTTLFTGVTSTTFGVGTDFSVNGNYNYISYCFAEKQGYSKFGSYVGNGTANNGPFIYTGFKPALIMIKSTTATGAHYLWDTKRNPFNGADDTVNAAEADAETSNGIMTVDVLSNGFKIKNTGANNGTNQSGTKYVYYAFAENPFTTSTGIPTTAR